MAFLYPLLGLLHFLGYKLNFLYEKCNFLRNLTDQIQQLVCLRKLTVPDGVCLANDYYFPVYHIRQLKYPFGRWLRAIIFFDQRH